MKRIKILLVLLAAFVLTGCANTLKCEVETPNYNASLKVRFEDDKPITYKYKDEMFFDINDTNSEIEYHSLYEKYTYLINDDLASIKNQNKKIVVKVNYDFEKDKSDGENILLISRNDTMKEARKKIESSGYKCK